MATHPFGSGWNKPDYLPYRSSRHSVHALLAFIKTCGVTDRLAAVFCVRSLRHSSQVGRVV